MLDYKLNFTYALNAIITSVMFYITFFPKDKYISTKQLNLLHVDVTYSTEGSFFPVALL